MNDLRDYVSTTIAARKLYVAPGTIRRYCRDGKLSHIRTLGGQFRVERTALETLLAAYATASIGVSP